MCVPNSGTIMRVQFLSNLAVFHWNNFWQHDSIPPVTKFYRPVFEIKRKRDSKDGSNPTHEHWLVKLEVLLSPAGLELI